MNLADAPNLASIDANERDDDQINLLEYWHVLVDRRWIVAGVAACVFVLALAATLLATPVFRASSTLQIEMKVGEHLKAVGVGPRLCETAARPPLVAALRADPEAAAHWSQAGPSAPPVRGVLQLPSPWRSGRPRPDRP